MITVQQMEQALRKQGSVVEQEELDRLVAALDADRSGGAATCPPTCNPVKEEIWVPPQSIDRSIT